MRRLIAPLTSVLLLGGAGSAFAGGSSHFPSALPPTSNPGECYTQVKIPAQYSTRSENVLKADGFANFEVTEPQFQTRQESIMTKEPSVRYVVRQPSYRSVTEQILTRPGHDRLTVAPAQFSTVTENLQTSAPHLVWKRGNPGELQRQGYVIHSTADGRLNSSGGYQGGSYASTQSGGDTCGPGCEIWCLVEEPGTSVTTSRRAMSAPPRVIRTPVAPQYKTVSKQVVSDPGGVEEIPIPAEYAHVTVENLIRPAEAYEVTVPPVYGEVATKQLISPERYEWRRVLCQPGTGTVRGSSHTSSGSTYSSGGGHYSSGTRYSGGSSYSSGSTTTYSPSYSRQTYGSSRSYSGAGSTGYTPQSSSGYYGTENFPAYKHRAPHRKRR